MRNGKHSKGGIRTCLPGRFTIARGTMRDYAALAPFHYVAPKPATVAGVWTVRYRDGPRSRVRPVAVGVLSYPVPSSDAREWFLRREHFTRAQNLRFANRHIRTISRVIVHPQFRSIGLSTWLVRTMCRRCTTRYVEAFAAMGRVHPFFTRAGMTSIEVRGSGVAADRPVYFIFDRHDRKERKQ